MLAKVPVISTLSSGVDEYIDNGIDGVIVENEPRALARAIEWVVAPENDVALKQLVENAYARVSVGHEPGDYRAELLKITETALARRSAIV